jgi:predicted TPR repeat methyltransferase
MARSIQQSSGDLLADRRSAMAEAYLADGDAQAAADLLRQAVEIAPRWPAGWFRLGEVLEEKLADAAGAADAFRTAARLDRDDLLGAAARLGRLRPDDPNARMSRAYVAKLFDQYAPRFETHLRDALVYRGPEIMMGALGEVCAGRNRQLRFASALDLGCGTGLMARAIRPHVDTIDGVDVSPEMVRMAAETGLYRDVRVGDAVEALLRASPLAEEGGVAPETPDEGSRRHLETEPSLILAADVLCYIKDLTQLFQGVAQAIPKTGLFAFTCQSNGAPGVMLGADMRYSHDPGYIRDTADMAGLAILHFKPSVVRRDRGRDVPGHVAVLGRA